MIVAHVNDHVGPRRHVTFDASRGPRAGFVEIVPWRIVLRRGMALQANAVALATQL